MGNKPLEPASDNLHLWRLGEACREAADPKQPVVDYIDRGLILLRLLNERGYDVVPREGTRACTCHPDDNPPKPCPRKYALAGCRAAAAKSSGGRSE